VSTVIAPLGVRTRPGRGERRAERRRLKRHDVLGRRLAELHAMDALLDRAADVVRHGWVQGGWFTVDTPTGNRVVTAYDIGLAERLPVTGACLVGAVVQAAGGPSTVRSQLVQRTLDLLWHTLREEPGREVRWCPGPRVRTMGVLELTHWNDAKHRTRAEVVGLLEAARRTADSQVRLCRAEQTAVDAIAR
jgi:hypothetical protein